METIRIHSSSGESIEQELPCSAASALEGLFPALAMSSLACCRVNGRLRSLSALLDCPSLVDPVPWDSSEGLQVQRRTLCFLVFAATTAVLPDKSLKIAHAMGEGFYFHFLDSSMDAQEIQQIQTALDRLLDSGQRIVSRPLSWEDAIARFMTMGRDDTVLLLEDHHEAEVWINSLGPYMDLDHGTLAWDLAGLPDWELLPWDKGFWFGPRNGLKERNYGSIHRIYQESEGWGSILETSTVGQLNQKTRNRQIKDFVWTAEALHQQKIAELALTIAERKDRPRLVLIAGPSSSGKTTFSKKLSIQLKVMGFTPVALSLDDYFLPREKTPLDEEGRYDFESLHALDIDLLNEHLLQFFNGEEVDVPSFDFKIGDRIFGKKKQTLPQGGILVMEGIHGINDQLTPLVPGGLKFKIFVSALTQLNVDLSNRISTTDNRLIRRMVRDNRYRGYSAEETLNMWPSVRRGENRNIFPFQESADAVFNSAMDYELGVLKTYAEPLLKTVRPTSTQYAEARRILQFVQSFLAIPSELVPENSILREFIGGSAFKY